jgi:hypothetical protein
MINDSKMLKITNIDALKSVDTKKIVEGRRRKRERGRRSKEKRNPTTLVTLA